MKTQNQPFFNLQRLLAHCVHQIQTGTTIGPAIQIVDDFVAPVILAGCEKNLEKILLLLLKNAVGAPVEKIVLTTRQLLQTEKDVLLEFSIADELGKLNAENTYVPDNVRLMQAEAMINEMGGKSERIHVLASGVGMKFILKYGWKGEGELQVVKPQSLLEGRRVLVAEDNEINQKTIVHLLQKEGMVTDIASDGKTAIDLFERKGSYDVVILDLQMPHMNGFDAAGYIRKRLKSTVPIIGMTAFGFGEQKAECLQSGMNDCLTKPFNPEDLISLISHYVLEEHSVLHNNFEAIRSAV